MMIDTDRRLSRVMGRRVGSRLEGVGVLVTWSELSAFCSSAPGRHASLVKWLSRRDRRARFFVFANEE